jgi:hypothetical protein
MSEIEPAASSDVQPSSSSDLDLDWLQRALAIVSLVLAVFMPVIGLVGSVVSLMWARSNGASTTIPKWGIVVSVIFLIISVVVGILALILVLNAVSSGTFNIDAVCAHRDSWGWLLDSLRFICR